MSNAYDYQPDPEVEAALTGMPRDEIVRRGIIKGEIPIYGLAGALGMGAIAEQSQGGDR